MKWTNYGKYLINKYAKMKIIDTFFSTVLLMKPKIIVDKRGTFSENFNSKIFKKKE